MSYQPNPQTPPATVDELYTIADTLRKCGIARPSPVQMIMVRDLQFRLATERDIPGRQLIASTACNLGIDADTLQRVLSRGQLS